MSTQHNSSLLVSFYFYFFLGEGGGIIDLQRCNDHHLQSDFPSKFQSSMTIFITKLLTREGRYFGQWMNSSIIHDNIRSFIHKNCHPESYHSDIKYHMTLNNNIFSADVQSNARGDSGP